MRISHNISNREVFLILLFISSCKHPVIPFNFFRRLFLYYFGIIYYRFLFRKLCLHKFQIYQFLHHYLLFHRVQKDLYLTDYFRSVFPPICVLFVYVVYQLKIILLFVENCLVMIHILHYYHCSIGEENFECKE